MELSRKSLWYRLAQYGTLFEFTEYKTNNICKLIKSIMIGLFLTIVVIPVIAVCGILVIVDPIIEVIFALFTGSMSYIDQNPLFLIGTTLYFAIFLVAIVYGIYRLIKKITKKINIVERMEINPFVEYIKAKKAKICTVVTFKN